jgi:hypothetical protein
MLGAGARTAQRRCGCLVSLLQFEGVRQRGRRGGGCNSLIAQVLSAPRPLPPQLGRLPQDGPSREHAYALLAEAAAAHPLAAAAAPLAACLLERLRAADAGVAAAAAAAAHALLPGCGAGAPRVVRALLGAGAAGALPQWRGDAL